MFGSTRWNPVDDVFNFQREIDRMFNQFWNDLPTRTAAGQSPSFQANATNDGWRIDVPLPGIDPDHVKLEAAGNTLTIRADEPGEKGEQPLRYEQSVTIPQFLDLDRITASHKHGMLRLTVPLKESVKPRRIQIATPEEDRKHLAEPDNHEGGEPAAIPPRTQASRRRRLSSRRTRRARATGPSGARRSSGVYEDASQ